MDAMRYTHHLLSELIKLEPMRTQNIEQNIVVCVKKLNMACPLCVATEYNINMNSSPEHPTIPTPLPMLSGKAC